MSAPYQSHLFQSIQSQVRHIKDAVQLRWRQLSNVTLWGMQVGVYSLAQLFQVGRWTARTLGAQAVRGARQLRASLGIEETPPVVDQPIQRVLAALKLQSQGVPSPVASHWQVTLTPSSTAKPLWKRSIELLQSCARLLGVPSAVQPFALPMPSGHLVQRSPDQSLQRSRVTHHPWLSTVRSWLPRLLLTRPSGLLARRNHSVSSLSHRSESGPSVVTTLVATLWHQGITALQRFHPRTPTPLPPVAEPSMRGEVVTPIAPSIQGIASSLIHHQLVLVTTGNQVLDILTTPQQQQLSDRIAFELASAQRDGHSVMAPHPLRFLSPRRLFRQLPVGIRHMLVAGLGAVALLPFTVGLSEPAQAATPALPLPLSSPFAAEWLMDPTRTRRRTEEETSLTGPLGRPAAGKIRVPIQKTPTPLQRSAAFPQEIMAWVAHHRLTPQAGNSATVDVKAVFAGYQPHILERLLHGLDRGLTWLEPRLIALWQHWWPVIRQAMQTAVAVAKPWIAAQWTRFWQQVWPILLRVSRQILVMLFAGVKALLARGWKKCKPAVQKWVQARFQV